MILARLTSLALLLVVAAPVPAPAQTPEPKRIELSIKDLRLATDWYGLYIRGTKIGWLRTETALAGKGADQRVFSKTDMEMKITSLGKQGVTRTTSELEFEGSAPFRLVRIKSTSINDDVKQYILAKRAGDAFEATVETGGRVQKRRIEGLDYALGDEKGVDVWLKRKPATGEAIAVRNLDTETLEIDVVTHTLLATRKTRVSGVDLTVSEVKSFFPRSQMTVVSKTDDRDRTLHIDMLGFLEGRLETEAQAKNTTFSTDLFTLTTAKTDRQLGRHERIESVTLEIVGQGLGAWIKSGPNQLVETGSDGKLLVKLGPKAAAPVKATGAEIAAAVADNIAFPIKDPKVKALAEQAVGDATTARARLERIVSFVNGYIRPSLDPAPPRLLDLIERKSGDCKAYAMLVIALAKASGLPAREISGLLYLGDNDQAFGGHAWAEVVIDGEWLPVDASIPLMRIGGGHIRFGEGEAGLSAFTAVMAAGGMSLRVVDIESAH